MSGSKHQAILGTSAGAMLGALLALAAASPPAQAQNNSLLHAQRTRSAQSAATSQPAAPRALSPAAGVGVRPPPSPRDLIDPPPVNMVLMAVSPIAVDAPKPKKIQVHDLVTVIVRESRTSLNDAKMKSEKDWQMKSELTKWLRLDPKHHLVPQNFEANGTPGVSFDFNNTYDTKGNYDRKDELITRITASVVDVKPNGNLVLEASKVVGTASDETVTATLIGECRSADVTVQNTVLSTQVANLKIEIRDTGAVRDATRRGWLMRLFDLARPI
jgi:flagellar L-ring protein precursor FlgH